MQSDKTIEEKTGRIFSQFASTLGFRFLYEQENLLTFSQDGSVRLHFATMPADLEARPVETQEEQRALIRQCLAEHPKDVAYVAKQALTALPPTSDAALVTEESEAVPCLQFSSLIALEKTLEHLDIVTQTREAMTRNIRAAANTFNKRQKVELEVTYRMQPASETTTPSYDVMLKTPPEEHISLPDLIDYMVLRGKYSGGISRSPEIKTHHTHDNATLNNTAEMAFATLPDMVHYVNAGSRLAFVPPVLLGDNEAASSQAR